MLYLFSGDDVKSKLASYEQFIKSMPPGLETFFIGKNDFDSVQVENFYSGAGLFFSKCAVVFSSVFEREENQDFILKNLESLERSTNFFVFLEGKLNKPVLDAFKRVRAELNVFELPKEKKEKFNNFLLADAFGQKDKLNLWIYFRQAMERGVGLEELTGVLFWKVKNMLLKKDFRKFSPADLKNSASRLSYLLPEARKESRDAETAFEQFLLEAF